MFQTFAETSAIALQADATREQLKAANTAMKALSDAITVATEEGLASRPQARLSLDSSPSTNSVVIDISTEGAAEEKGGAPQDGDIEEGRGGGGDH